MMSDFSLVPVDYQPDFGDVSLVPVDYDPFSGNGATQQVLGQPQTPQRQPVTGTGQPNAGVPTNYAQHDVAGDPNASSSPFAPDTRVAANDGMPGNNQAQNAQVRAIVVELGLDKDQRQQLHAAISGQGYGYHEIRQIAIDMFGK
jgi:hypothetical protein